MNLSLKMKNIEIVCFVRIDTTIEFLKLIFFHLHSVNFLILFKTYIYLGNCVLCYILWCWCQFCCKTLVDFSAKRNNTILPVITEPVAGFGVKRYNSICSSLKSHSVILLYSCTTWHITELLLCLLAWVMKQSRCDSQASRGNHFPYTW